jgi:L-lactate dehydrogenase complex protein LldF
VSEALADEALRAAIGSTSAAKIDARAAAVAEVENFEALRDLAARVKQHTIENLEHYLEQFIAGVEARGGTLHLAATPAEANECIVGIARENGLELCVKSKSMTSEETGLNQALEAANVRVVETDLGEFIVQLDHDRPSHIVTPIIHKNRKVIARALAREIGVEYTEDPEALTMHARRYLRDIFRRCDLGVSGVNFAVAETGTICICTNEGNGRLTTTRPKVHVALMGIEKLVPRMADLAVFLKVLARSSTGQPITVYTSLISGPKRPADPDGPEQLHVVILDGGRRRIQAGEYGEVLRCIRCGACLNACPVYRRIGGHAYGNVYPGPIGKLIAPLLNDVDYYADLPQASSLCGLCYEVCPVRIDIPALLIRLRRDQVARRSVPWGRRIAFRWMFRMLSSPRLLRLGQKLARLGTALGADGNWNTRLPGPARRLTEFRDTPRPAARSFRQLWKREKTPDQDA